MKPESIAQLTLPLSVFTPPVITPNGDGYTVRPGRPIHRLTPAQFAAQFGVTADTIYLWIADGTIDPKHVEPAGKRKLLIAAAAVEECQAKFRALRD